MLQRVGLKMVTSRGAEGSQVGVKSGKLEPLSRQNEATVSNIRSGAFDLTTGILTLEFHDGTAVNVMGFATESNLPRGPRGEDGEPGRDGRPGPDGRDGTPGDRGCTGPEGDTGATGGRGEDGRDGREGPVGPPGPDGNIGPQGPTGPTGPTGATGPTGPTGATGPTGPTGPAGSPGNVNIIVASADPGNVPAGTIWVNPTIGQPGS